MDDLIKQGATAFKAGDREKARKLLSLAIKESPNDERAWGWMYNVSITDKERIFCLKQMIRINPKNEKAHQLINEFAELEPPLDIPQPNNNRTILSSKKIRIGIFSVFVILLSVIVLVAWSLFSDPSQSLEAKASFMENEPSCNVMGKYTNLAYDVRKTNSLVSPYTGTISGTLVTTNKNNVHFTFDFTVNLAYQDGKWIPKSVDYTEIRLDETYLDRETDNGRRLIKATSDLLIDCLK